MSVHAGKNLLCLCGLILFFINVCRAVKINSITVPARYEIKEDAEALILDCDFTINQSETGFVLKWMHNNVAIYQWIPSKKDPIALGNFKNRINTNYTTSDDRFKKHSALFISQPSVADSGSYTCNVQSFQGSDKQSSELQIIDPEDSIDLGYTINQEDDSVDLKCIVSNIFPEPEVKLLFDNEERTEFEYLRDVVNRNNSVDVILSTKVKKSEIKDESPVSCVVTLPKADYIKRETKTYDDPKQSATTKKSIPGELTKSQSETGATNENNSQGLKNSLSIILMSFVVMLIH